MDFLYQALIYIHVLSVIASIGPFFILFPLIKKLPEAEGQLLESYLETFRFVVTLTKHAGHVLVGSGILLVVTGPWTWVTPWIVMTLVIMFGSLFFLARAFSPLLRQFLEGNQDKPALASKLHYALWKYLVLLALMLWFMVAKPALWW
ncbi:hypothetical protein [Mesobacillus foraminis]|uniref:Uncharacterized protein n=1 Tax=Mesobacillus foraminis TaxID=279826 RepID=A0A4V2RE41_9BACI|nr:hypothetical protein [Mesobacillus foraminis]TCN27250.1 hypothetical protein EV146_102197 [Mesobacillus foraminis]